MTQAEAVERYWSHMRTAEQLVALGMRTTARLELRQAARVARKYKF